MLVKCRSVLPCANKRCANQPSLPASIDVPVHHVQQEGNWDCGIACVAMVVSEQSRTDILSRLNRLGDEEGFHNSVWTIDLAYLLKKYKVPHVYYTITLGVDPGYSKEDFYTKVIDLDQERVQSRFERAADCSIEVHQRSLKLDEILNHLSKEQLAIVLVDSNLLRCDSCTSLFENSIFQWPCCQHKTPYNEYHDMQSGIQTKGMLAVAHLVAASQNAQAGQQFDKVKGHFVVLCGYSVPTRRLLYRNPTYKDRICSISFDDFETARHSYGTDDDIILVMSA